MDKIHELNCVITNQQVEIEALKLENRAMMGAIKNLTGLDWREMLEQDLVERIKPKKVKMIPKD